MKKLKGAILSQNHRRSQESGPVGPGIPQLKCHQWQKFEKKNLFLHFQFLLASLRTTVHTYNSN